MANIRDVFFNAKDNYHFVITGEFTDRNFFVKVLTKTHPLYEVPITTVSKASLLLKDFALVGSNFKHK